MIPYVHSNINEKLLQIAEEKDKKEDWLLSPNYYPWYFSIGHFYKPKRILEIGVRYGYSLYCLILGSEYNDNKVECISGIDMEDEARSNEIAINNIKSITAVNFDLVKDETENLRTLRHLWEEGSFDLIHLDSSHTENVLHEINLAWPILKKGGVLVLDDFGSHQTSSEFIVTKRNLILSHISMFIYRNEIKGHMFINSFRGTFIIQKNDV